MTATTMAFSQAMAVPDMQSMMSQGLTGNSGGPPEERRLLLGSEDSVGRGNAADEEFTITAPSMWSTSALYHGDEMILQLCGKLKTKMIREGNCKDITSCLEFRVAKASP